MSEVIIQAPVRSPSRSVSFAVPHTSDVIRKPQSDRGRLSVYIGHLDLKALQLPPDATASIAVSYICKEYDSANVQLQTDFTGIGTSQRSTLSWSENIKFPDIRPEPTKTELRFELITSTKTPLIGSKKSVLGRSDTYGLDHLLAESEKGLSEWHADVVAHRRTNQLVTTTEGVDIPIRLLRPESKDSPILNIRATRLAPVRMNRLGV